MNLEMRQILAASKEMVEATRRRRQALEAEYRHLVDTEPPTRAPEVSK